MVYSYIIEYNVTCCSVWQSRKTQDDEVRVGGSNAGVGKQDVRFKLRQRHKASG